MFSHDLTLSDFVCSIPICHSEADLGSILHIFHQTHCDCLAISSDDFNWGIISSNQLLSLIAEAGEKLSTIASGHPRKRFSHRNLGFDISENSLHDLIEPAIIYQANTKLSEFFKSIEDNCLHISQSKYLIVNSSGKLQGRLDRDKLLRYTGAEFNQHTPQPPFSTSSVPWLSLLDNLALPLKIETAEQKNCYENQYWQKLISGDRGKPLVKSQELNVSIANWWMNKQLDITKEDGEHHQQTSKTQSDGIDDLCCLNDCFYSIHQPKPNISQAVGLGIQPPSQLLVDYFDNSALFCLLEDSYLNSVKYSSSDMQIESGREWNYIRIPLTLEVEQKTAYWLMLAIKPFLLQPDEPQNKHSSSVTKSTVNHLLATISHELKSPLTGIVGLSNLLSSQKLGKLNQRQAGYLELIRNGGQKLMAIVNDLIELTNLTTGKIELKPEKIALVPLFHNLYQQIIAQFQKIDSTEVDLLISTSGIELKIEPEQEIAIADRLRLSSIFSHLMLETVQFNGSPSIAITVEVKSSGQGIIAIFKSKTDKNILTAESSNLVGQDVGLNLVIAKYLAQTLQGEIKSVYTSTDCSFTLNLPTVNSPAPVSLTSANAPASRHNSLRNLTILSLYPETEVINASAGNNHGLDFNLKKWAEQDWCNDNQQKLTVRHRIIEADGLEQAHTLARIWQLDVIVLDGYQIIDPEQYLRSLQGSKHLAALPLITLDTKTSEAANQIEGLNVYPCLLPAQCRSVTDLMQVIQIATEQ